MNRSIQGYIIPFSAAVMLTFQRNGLLYFNEIYTLFDLIINYCVSGVALFLFIRQIYGGKYILISRKDIPFIVLLVWIIFIISLSYLGNSSIYTFTFNQSAIISCIIAIILGLGIKPSDFSRLRRSLIILSAIFSILVLIYVPSDIFLLSKKISIDSDIRIGSKVSASMLIVLPRALYTLVLAGLGSFIIEKKYIVKFFSILVIIIPLIIAFGTAGRGGLLGFFSGVIIFIVGIFNLNKSNKKYIYLFYFIIILLSFYFIYLQIEDYFPILYNRVLYGNDSGRYEIWNDLINIKLSLIGYGPLFYPHNPFLEMVINYGIIGFILFIIFVINSLFNTVKLLSLNKDIDLLFVVVIVTFQFVSQQFSLDIFYSSFCLAMAVFSRLNLKMYNNKFVIFSRHRSI